MSGRPYARVRLAVRALVCAGVIFCVLVGPAVASAAGWLAFTYEREDWDDVYICTSSGTRLTGRTLDGLSFHPTWSPDGTRIAYIRRSAPAGLSSARDIRTMRANGSNNQLLRTWSRGMTAIEWSPSSRYMAVADYSPSTGEARILRLDLRTGATRLLYSRTDGSQVLDLAWAASGDTLAFCTRRGTYARSYLVNVNTREVRAAPIRNAWAVNWSRSTGKLAFRSQLANNWSRVWVREPSGRIWEMVTRSAIRGISWSPDASMLAMDGQWASCPVQAYPCIYSGLMTIRGDGSDIELIRNDTRLQQPKWVMSNPEWQPTVTKQAPSIAASVPDTCAYGGPAKMTFTLKNAAGGAIAGRTVVVQSSSDARSWQTVTSELTDYAGRVTATGSPKTLRYYRAFFAGDGTYGQVTGAIHSVKPKASLTKPELPSDPAKGAFFTVKGYLKPQGAAGSMPVSIYAYHKESGDWVLRRISSAKLSDYSSYSRYKATMSLQYRGSWRARAVFEGNSSNASTNSSWRYFSVR